MMTVAQLRLPFVAFSVLVALGACSPVVETRGNLPAPDAVAAIKPGQTRSQVAQLLGSPSNVSTFNDKTWYYISRKTETEAFFAPKPVDQQVVKVRFDDAGIVTGVEKQLGLDEAKAVTPSARVTPTAGHTFGFLEQLFGNVGRFGGPGGAGGRSRPGGP